MGIFVSADSKGGGLPVSHLECALRRRLLNAYRKELTSRGHPARSNETGVRESDYGRDRGELPGAIAEQVCAGTVRAKVARMAMTCDGEKSNWPLAASERDLLSQ
jgi:hypothetical protein